jgi:hypothetical protein
LYYNSAKSCFFNKIFAAKERKEHIDKNLCCLFFAIFAIFCGNSSLVAASAALGFLRFFAAIPSVPNVVYAANRSVIQTEPAPAMQPTPA